MMKLAPCLPDLDCWRILTQLPSKPSLGPKPVMCSAAHRSAVSSALNEVQGCSAVQQTVHYRGAVQFSAQCSIGVPPVYVCYPSQKGIAAAAASVQVTRELPRLWVEFCQRMPYSPLSERQKSHRKYILFQIGSFVDFLT